jgi:DNA-binding transcriptional ArsR family regulator
MMSPLAEILSSRSRAEVFRLLFGVANAELHNRDLERRSGLSESAVRRELARLTRLGLLVRRVDGNRVYYRADRKHPLYPEIHNLVLKTTGLVDVLRDALEGESVDAAFVFGSVARGGHVATSDIDLMVIGQIGLRRLSGLLRGCEERIGREVNPHILTRAELKARLAAADHFLTSVMKDAKLFVIGDENALA